MSWLNVAECEIGVLEGQCLDRRIKNEDILVAAVAAWEFDRNAAGAKIDWKFTREKASKVFKLQAEPI